MDFVGECSRFIGQTIEVFYTNQFIEGQLLDVEELVLLIRCDSVGYAPDTTELGVFIDQIGYIRILAE